MTRRPRKPRFKVRRKPAPRTGRIAKPSNSAPVDTMDDFIAAAAAMLELKIKKAWMPAVRGHLAVTLRHGARVMDLALPDDSEPAPVYEP